MQFSQYIKLLNLQGIIGKKKRKLNVTTLKYITCLL